jgi:hypothetical protein
LAKSSPARSLFGGRRRERGDGLFKQQADLGGIHGGVEQRSSGPTSTEIELPSWAKAWAAALGMDLTAVEDRFRAVIFLDGGFYNEKVLPGTDQIDFAPQIKVPAFIRLGQVRLDVSAKRRADAKAWLARRRQEGRHFRHGARRFGAARRLGREVLAWLDKYLGKVN